MRGFADIHNHQFANLAFGGEFVSGNAYGPIASTLGSDGKHSYRHVADWMGAWVDGSPFFPYNYSNGGYPDFDGWPNFWEVNHQHVYEDWLLHSVQGGLRLMVMMAVDSPPLCSARIPTDGRNCNDEMHTIQLQLDEAKNMEASIDRRAGGPGLGWYRIVRTPAEARQVIMQGKLAVVLGVETAHLFNCKAEPCPWNGGFESLWNQGVRHFFPIHQDKNAFGGPSYFEPHIQVQANWVGDWFNPEHWFSPYKLPTRPCPQYAIGRCDDLGLTTSGRAFVQALMSRGALIDVDHMSDRSFSETLDLAEVNNYPVIASHSSFNEIKHGVQDHEGQLTPSELQRIRHVRGMLGLISSLLSNDGDRTQVDTYTRPGKNTIPHVCGRSTETFAQGYYYALDHAPGMSLAIGTDFNGGLKEVGPRFGARECDGGIDSSKSRNTRRLAYPFFARGTEQSMTHLVSGKRTFDFNVDGLANMGLLPDMFADLEVDGMSAQDVEPIFHSAEGYVRLWERAEAFANTIHVLNSGFETGSLSSWGVFSPQSNFAASAISGAGIDGGSAAAEAGAGGIVFQDVAGLTPGRPYLVSAWTHTSLAASAPGELSVHDTTGTNYQRLVVPPTPGWHQVSLLYRANSTGRLRIHLVRSDGGGTLYWDDVAVTPQ